MSTRNTVYSRVIVHEFLCYFPIGTAVNPLLSRPVSALPGTVVTGHRKRDMRAPDCDQGERRHALSIKHTLGPKSHTSH